MKKIYLLLLLALVSCLQETPQGRSVSVSLRPVDVKSAFSSDRSSVLWENGDKIGVYHDGSGMQNTPLVYAGQNDMTVSLSTDATCIFSIFPYTASSGETPSDVKVTIPVRQNQHTPGMMTGEIWPMAASGAIENNHADLTFTPLTALLALNIYSSEPENGEWLERWYYQAV